MSCTRWMASFTVLLLAPFANAQPKDLAADFFKPAGPVPKVAITLDPESLKLLGKDPRKYVSATIKVGDTTYPDVGIHLKGAAGSWRDWNDKPGLTLNFNKFKRAQLFNGLDKMYLNNSVQDESYLHELLANELALAMGLPATRCAHALVELNGRKVGIYVMKEGFDAGWLKRHFKDSAGNLYDGGFLMDINGELKLDHGIDNGRKDLKALVKACNEGDAKKRYEAVGKLIDVDLFCANAALQIVATDWDGYMRKPNNYRIYFPKDGKGVFIPHGMDQLWQNPGEGLWQGWGGMVARAVLDSPEGKKTTLAKLKEMQDKYFTVEKLNKRIDELVPRLKDAMKTVDKNWPKNYENEVRGLKERLKQRVEYLTKEVPKLK
ncbi:CotH kinase family protein [Limnoglobus roseus]|uniref:Spore coat protein CotH n=1 Tax=Limnoglobus roseus TaxID=2598579 RepID=A0A5C1AG87_9BACT|nr:CotH kinase family protein [Limnoglobus roseus]QEL18439.1 spore coat protein CotH [Limnoglobus roseus]